MNYIGMLNGKYRIKKIKKIFSIMEYNNDNFQLWSLSHSVYHYDYNNFRTILVEKTLKQILDEFKSNIE